MTSFRCILCIILLNIVPVFVLAQESEDTSQEILFDSNLEHGGYGAMTLKVSPILDKAQLFTGGYGGWFLNHTFMIGLGGYGLTSQLSLPDAPKSPDGRAPGLSVGYGGLMLEYTHNSHKLLHFNGNVFVGAGGAGYTWTNSSLDNSSGSDFWGSDAFFVAELGINAELNVASFARVSIGGSYRLVSGLSLAGLDNKELSGPAGNINFKFGKF